MCIAIEASLSEGPVKGAEPTVHEHARAAALARLDVEAPAGDATRAPSDTNMK